MSTPSLGLGTNAFNMGIAAEMSYSNLIDSNGPYGTGWSNPSIPHLVQDGSDVIYEAGPNQSVVFTSAGSGAYTAGFFVRDKLSYASGLFTLAMPNGRKKIFNASGYILKDVDQDGNETVFSYVSEGIDKITMSFGGETVEYKYAYNVTDQVSTITLLEDTVEKRRTVYSYTGTNLEKIQLQVKSGASWVNTEATSYRYDGSGRLEYAFGHAAHDQLQLESTAYGKYADYHYQYDADGRVSKVFTHGGKYCYKFQYLPSPYSGTTMNTWTSKTVVTQFKDGENESGLKTVRTYWLNNGGQVLGEREQEFNGGTLLSSRWVMAQVFDADGRALKIAESSAIQSISDGQQEPVNLKTTGGLIRIFSYFTSGSAAGYLEYEGVQNGTSGVEIKQQEYTYSPKTVGGVTVVRVATLKVYRNSNVSGGSDPVTTTYTYPEYWGSTLQLKRKVTSFAGVPSGENGDGMIYTIEEHFDEFGFLVKQVDERGVATTYSHERRTGALKQKIEDQGSGKLNLTTDYLSDELGRITEELGPVHQISVSGAAKDVRQLKVTQYLDASDEVRVINGYMETAGAQPRVTINPIRITRHSAVMESGDAKWIENEIEAMYGSSGIPAPTASFTTQSAWRHWVRQVEDHGRDLEATQKYFNIPSSGLGDATDNYGETKFSYDGYGRLAKRISPEGTRYWSEYDYRGWLLKELTGISDTFSEETTFAVRLLDYSDDGKVTKETRPVDATAGNNRVTDFRYDWRTRLDEEETNDGTRVIITKYTYDNRGNVTGVKEYVTSVTANNLIAQAESFFDGRNRLYRTKRYGIDLAATGAARIKAALTTERYYDPSGNLEREIPGGKVGFVVYHYDAVNRVIRRYVGYGGTAWQSSSGGSGPDLGNIGDATIIEQEEILYDAASNAIRVIARQRFDDATGLGELKTVSTQPKARVSYGTMYPDGIGRPQAEVNYGTNGGAAFTRPTTIPTRADTRLMTTFVYNDAGLEAERVDAKAIRFYREYDDARRTTKSIENYQPGQSANHERNVTTVFLYNRNDQMTRQTAENGADPDQITQWLFGVTTGGGSTYNNNDVLSSMKLWTAGTDSGAQVTTYKRNRQDDVIEMQDPATTLHVYKYDKVGRLTEDAVTTFGANINNTVAKIQRVYQVWGLLEKVTSRGTGSPGTLRNEVLFEFDHFGQLAKDWQEHNGQVTGSTKVVGYLHATGAGNTVRLTGMVYLDLSTTWGYVYASGVADAMSRVSSLTLGGSPIVTYRYLGLSVPVGVKYVGASNTEMTYQSGGTGDAGDQYVGLDRFGRLVQTLWKTGATNRVKSRYGRDRLGNIVWRRDDQAHAESVTTEDKYFWYDGMDRVKEYQRGQLTGTDPNFTGIVNKQQEEDFGYDAEGNWKTFNRQSPADSETRLHNHLNQITSLATSYGTLNPVTYDNAGNMRTVPYYNEGAGTLVTQNAVWDAWNRLITITDPDNSPAVITYAYDGLSRMVSRLKGSTRQHYYYDDQWRPVEEWTGGVSPTTIKRRYMWGIRDRWDLVRRQRSVGGTLDEHLYVLRDGLDPVAITNYTGAVQERYSYDAFGRVRFMNASFGALSASAKVWDWLFHCEFRDEDTDLYNYGYRWYHAILGRWLSRDPIGIEGGRNLYRFVGNNGVNRWDRLGLDCCCIDQPLKIKLTSEDAYPGLVAKIRFEISFKGSNDISSGCNSNCCEFRQDVAISGSIGGEKLLDLDPDPNEWGQHFRGDRYVRDGYGSHPEIGIGRGDRFFENYDETGGYQGYDIPGGGATLPSAHVSFWYEFRGYIYDTCQKKRVGLRRIYGFSKEGTVEKGIKTTTWGFDK